MSISGFFVISIVWRLVSLLLSTDMDFLPRPSGCYIYIENPLLSMSEGASVFFRLIGELLGDPAALSLAPTLSLRAASTSAVTDGVKGSVAFCPPWSVPSALAFLAAGLIALLGDLALMYCLFFHVHMGRVTMQTGLWGLFSLISSCGSLRLKLVSMERGYTRLKFGLWTFSCLAASVFTFM